MKVLNDLFKDSGSKIIDSVISGGGIIIGDIFSGKKGFFTGNLDKSQSVAEKIKKETGIQGFISTDELPKYGITADDRDNILKEFEAAENDAVIMVAGKEEKARAALEIIKASV